MAVSKEDRFAMGLVLSSLILAAAVIGVGVINAGVETVGAASGEASGAEVTVLDLSLTEFAIEGDLLAPPGPVQLQARNAGSAVHNIGLVDGPKSPDFGSGETASLDLGNLSPGSYTIICAIPGHRESGMEATLVVEEGATPPGGGDPAGEDPDWAALDQAMTDSILAFPAETEGRGNVPIEPTILPDGTKQFELTVAITPWEVEPGKIVDAWTYNGIVPGPAIRVDVGDNVRVIVHNELPMGTDVHWHGIPTPFAMDGVAPITQRLIHSGEDFVYEFEAERAAVGMYHAHHHGQMQVPNGLFGTFIIGDTPIPYGETISGITVPSDLEPALEIPLVLNDAGVIGFSLNGKSFPATEPYVLTEGDWIVAHYYNEGLQIHPMHQHQFPQLVFAKDGIPLDNPYWADTVNVAPGERYSVLMHADRAGTWVWHCHILNHVERETGMFGMVTALVVQEP
jgi:uncharacterized cupredoxin-like copper-binding protein